jgi:uncharacterized phage protein (TIGR01671 family)
MREILFRAKQIDTDKWVEGYYIKFETRQCCPIGDDKLADDEIVHLIAQDGFADWNMPRQLTFIKIKKETVGQFTGLTDKNGVKIFEGDLFEWTSKDTDGSLMRQVDVVRWADGGCWVCGKEDECLIHYLQFNPSYENLELIGNIHDKEVK